MNSFGLGLILSFTDNASAGMRRASQTFNEMNRISDQMVSASGSAVSSIETLSLAGYGLNVVGDQMTSVGSTIVSVFGSASQSIVNTGMEVMGFERQLTALYKSEDLAAQKMLEIQDYARKSIFETRDLISAVTVMKAVGIEAMDAVTSSSGKTTQSLLDYAADISAMFPNMHNAYGTGVNAAMGALKEYIAEGNARSLKAGAGLNITEMLGEEKGKTVEERTRQVADLIEMLGIAGYTASLAGTPTQQLSNMQDALYMALSKIANSGVLNTYTEMLSIVANYVNDLVEDEERFNTLTQIVGEVITAVLTPLKKAAEFLVKLVDSFLSFAEAHPLLAKTVGIVIAITGVALVAIGTVMKLSGSFLILFSSIKTVSDLLKSGKGLQTASRLLGVFKANFLPFIALAGLAYVAWKNNFFGIRDVITKTFRDVGTIISIISDAFVDNELSIDQFEKAKKLGILPLIESVLMLKYYAGKLFEGFKIGIEGFLETLSELTRSWGLFDSDVFGTAENLGEFLKNLTQPGAEETWRAIGEVLGKALVTTLLLYSTFKAMSGVIKIFKGISEAIKFIAKVFTPVIKLFKWFGTVGSLMKEGFGFFEVMGAAFPKIAGFLSKIGGLIAKLAPVFSKIGSVVVKLFTKLGPLFAKAGTVIAKIGGILAKIGSAIMSVLSAIASALGISVGWVVAIIVAIVAVIATIIVFRKQIAQFFKDLWVKIVDAFNKAKESIINIIPEIKEKLIETFNKAKDAVLGIVSKIKEKIADIVLKIKDFFSPVVNFFKEVWERISAMISSIVGAFKAGFNLVKTIIQNVVNVVSAIFNVIYQAVRWVALSIALFFKNAFIFVRDNVIQPIVDFLTQAFQWVKDNVIAPVCAFFISAWQAVVDFITRAFEWIRTNVITPICTFFIGAWQAVINFISQAIQWLRDSVLTPIANFFIGLWQGVVNAVSQAFQWLRDTVFAPIADFFIGVWQGILDFMTSVIDWFVQAFTNIREFIDGVLTFVKDKFFGILDAITEKVTSFFDGIKEVFNWIADKIDGIGSWLTDGINKVADYIKNDADSKEQELVGAATGGYVKTTGIGVLHPNELVVNDKMTQQLGAFLDNQTALSVAPVSASASTKSIGGQNVNSEGYIDNSVTFAAGSVVIQMNNASDAELEKVAEKLMKIIARKQQLKGMAVRK